MAANLGAIKATLEAETKAFSRSLKLAQKDLDGLDAKTAKTSSAMNKSFASLSKGAGLAARGIGALAVGVAAAGAAYIAFSKRQIDAADSLDKGAKQLSLSVAELQKWRFVADQSGIETAAFDRIFRKFVAGIGDFSLTGRGEAVDGLKALGIEIRNANGEMRSANDLFDEAVRKLSRVEDGVTRAGIAYKLFGARGLSVNQIAALTGDELDALIGEFNRLGIAIDQDTIDSLVMVKDEFARVADVLQANFIRAVGASSDQMLSLADTLTSPEFLKAMNDTVEFAVNAAEAFAKLVPWLRLAAEQMLVMSTAGAALPSILMQRFGPQPGPLAPPNSGPQLPGAAPTPFSLNAVGANAAGSASAAKAADKAESDRMRKQTQLLKKEIQERESLEERLISRHREATSTRLELAQFLHDREMVMIRTKYRYEDEKRAALLQLEQERYQIEVDQLNELERETVDSFGVMDNAVRGFGDTIGNIFGDLARDGQVAWDRILQAAISTLTQIASQALTTSLATGAVSAAGGGGGLLSFIGLASGGIVTRPTLAVIGESGPEAVVPLTGANAPNVGGSGPIEVVNQTAFKVEARRSQGASGQLRTQIVIQDALLQTASSGGAVSRLLGLQQGGSRR